MNEKILIVDDETSICELLKLELELEGYVCDTAFNGIEALEKFRADRPDLVLLDLMLPGISGYEVCKEMTAQTNVPIIMLTAKSETVDKITGLETGADDYITKPFETRELLARIKALIRRYHLVERDKPQELKNGGLLLKPESQEAFLNGKLLRLTTTEYDILKLLLKNKTKVFSRELIAKEIGVRDFQLDTRAIDMHIQRLRRKFSAATEVKYIETVFGIGYKMRNFDEDKI